jgi:hypothetical protein
MVLFIQPDRVVAKKLAEHQAHRLTGQLIDEAVLDRWACATIGCG